MSSSDLDRPASGPQCGAHAGTRAVSAGIGGIHAVFGCAVAPFGSRSGWMAIGGRDQASEAGR